MTVHLALPMSRVKTIMKSSADVDIVSKESIIVVTRAAEYFIKYLASEAHKDGLRGKKLEYDSVANVVNNDNRYEFLQEIIPRKITVAECFKIMKENNALDKEDDSESSSSESDEDDDSSSSSVEQIEEPEEEQEINHENGVIASASEIEISDSSDSDCVVIE